MLYFLAFVVFGKVDVGWMMPDTEKFARELMWAWPKLPVFEVQKETTKDGKGQVIYYTVPTRQLTPQDLAQMGVTNRTVKPAQPKR